MIDKIKHQRVEQAIQAGWNPETSQYPDQWSLENIALGQSAVSACVFQDYFGGDIISAIIRQNGQNDLERHYLNYVDGKKFDVTANYFPDGYRIQHSTDRESFDHDDNRSFLMASPGFADRYNKLRTTVEKKVKMTPAEELKCLVEDTIHKYRKKATVEGELADVSVTLKPQNAESVSLYWFKAESDTQGTYMIMLKTDLYKQDKELTYIYRAQGDDIVKQTIRQTIGRSNDIPYMPSEFKKLEDGHHTVLELKKVIASAEPFSIQLEKEGDEL